MSAAACANHPARDAIGVCVKCRTRVCAECSTKVDGINHCVACLAKMAHQDAAPAPTGTARGGVALAVLGVLLLSSLTWLLLEVALPG